MSALSLLGIVAMTAVDIVVLPCQCDVYFVVTVEGEGVHRYGGAAVALLCIHIFRVTFASFWCYGELLFFCVFLQVE